MVIDSLEVSDLVLVNVEVGVNELVSDSLKVDNETHNIGANIGYKFYTYKKLFLAPELFYERLNSNSNHGYLGTKSEQQNETVLNYRYGAKLNLGYDLNNKFSAFVNYGIGFMNYKVDWVKDDIGENLQRETLPSQVIGLGLLYNINNRLTAKLAWDRQVTNMKYIYTGLSSRARIETTKLGLIYNF